MHIIQTSRAPNPRRVRIFLAEKAVEMRFEELDLMQSDLKAGAFTKLNPWQRVPILVLDDGGVLAETVAICRYFEELYPAPALMGEGAFGRAYVEMWQRRVELGLFQAVTHVFRHLHPRMSHLEVPQVPAWGEANFAKVEVELSRLDDQLANCRFVAGDNYSIADITAFVAVEFMKPAKLELSHSLNNITRWRSEICARPSSQA